MQRAPTTAVSPSDGRSVPIVAFASGKGGCGKTTIALNFANIVSARGRVLLVDLDLNNHGTTSSFSAALTAETLTASRLIRGDSSGDPIAVKPEVLLVPAALPGEPMPDFPSASLDLASTLRAQLLQLARRLNVVCIVIDCFCGIDVLTTASFGAADHGIVVNEPDLVTFAGSLHLLGHLEAEFEHWKRAPSLHVVINRLRPPHTVRSLTLAYRDNLSKEIRETILCHFPYNEKIFRNYGRYPFVSDLIPKSLFVRKLHLLSYALFKDNHEPLLAPSVRAWSAGKLRRTYLASVDPAAVDAESLVMRFVAFPVLLQAWVVVAACVIGLGPRTPHLVWSLTVLMTFAALAIIAVSLARGTWESARLAWTLGAFRVRLARTVSVGVKRQELRGRAAFNLFAAFCMGSYAVTLLALDVVPLSYLFNVGPDAESSLVMRETRIALALPLRTIDLRNLTLDGDARYDRFRFTSRLEQSGDRIARVGGDKGTKIANGTLSALSGLTLSDVTFEKCRFESVTALENGNLALQIAESQFDRVVIGDPRPTEAADFDQMTFSKSRLTDTTLRVRGGTTIDLTDATVKRVTVEKVADAQDKGQTVTVLYNGPATDIVIRGAVSVNKKAAEGGPAAAIGARIDAAEREVDDLERLSKRNADRATRQSLITSAVDLAELYVVRGGTGDVERALARLDRLGDQPVVEGLDGYVSLIRVLARIRQGEPKEELAAAIAWKVWLETRRPSLQEWSWSWALWDADIGLSDTQKRLVELVREATPLVDNSQAITAPEAFLSSFQDVVTPPATPRVPQLYVQIGSSRDEVGLEKWLRTLHGKGYRPELYKTKSGLYAATLGKHPAPEAEALRARWLKDAGGQALLAAGYTYEDRVYPPQ